MMCPKCKSNEVHAGQRGWSLLSGFIGSGKVVLTCLNCGHVFKPGEQNARPMPLWIKVALFLFILFLIRYIGAQ